MQDTIFTIIENKIIAKDVYKMLLRGDTSAVGNAGEFVNIQLDGFYLRRPISVCDVEGDVLTLIYKVVGKGTEAMSKMTEGTDLQVMTGLGNGYDLEKLAGKKVLLLGGGIGIPPMVELAAALSQIPGTDVTAAMGYRNSDLFLTEELSSYGKLLIATEDGSVGTKGNVLDAVRENAVEPDAVCACGPMPMLRAVKKFAQEKGIPAYISLEERMACGVGACLGCVTKTVEVDSHSHVRNARICTEGPVFDAQEVAI